MIRWIIQKKIDSIERQYGVSMEYVRYTLKHSLPSFLKFAKMLGVSQCRRALPVVPYHVARIVAARHADCGPCVQFEIGDAKKAGVPSEILAIVVDGQPELLHEDAAAAYRFVEAVIMQDSGLDNLRASIVDRFGDAGLIELSMAIGACWFFPLYKRGLGFSASCSESNIMA